jgi:hypothetical protein
LLVTKLKVRVTGEVGATGFVEIVIPASVAVGSDECFSEDGSLSFVGFESESRLSRIGVAVFIETFLDEMILPSSVEFLGEWCFS